MSVKDTDKGAKAFFAAARELGSKRIKVGIQEPEASDTHHSGLPMAGIGSVHEFGYSPFNIPERSFLRSTADENQKKYLKELGGLVKMLGTAPEKVLGELVLVGEGVRSDVLKKIRQGIEPELSEARQAQRRESGPPLIDTGGLIGSITSKVVAKK